MVVVVDIHTITMIANTVLTVVPVVVLLGTMVTIPRVVRVVPVKVIMEEMQQTLITIPVVVVVPVKRGRVQIPNHTVVTVYHPIFWERNIGGPVVVEAVGIVQTGVMVVKVVAVGVP